MHPGIGAHVYLPNLPTFAIMLPLILLKYPCIVFLFAKFSTLGIPRIRHFGVPCARVGARGGTSAAGAMSMTRRTRGQGMGS